MCGGPEAHRTHRQGQGGRSRKKDRTMPSWKGLWSKWAEKARGSGKLKQGERPLGARVTKEYFLEAAKNIA